MEAAFSIRDCTFMEVEGFDSLIRRAQAGERRAMEKLLAEIRPYLAKVACGYADPSRASESASDLLQEAELRAWQGLEQFNGGAADEETHAKFRTWVVQIVRRISLDRTRAKNTQKRKAPGGRIRSLSAPQGKTVGGSSVGPAEPPAKSPTPSTGLMAMERAALVERALARIPDRSDREIIRLYFFEQLTLPRIADRLGWTYDRVRECYRRGIRQLERHLHDLKPG